MSKTHVFHYSQLIPTDASKTVQKLAEYSGLRPEMIAEISQTAQKKGEIISEYKLGRISTPEFRIQINKCIRAKQGIELLDEDFDEAWCAMCEPNREIMVGLAKLQQDSEFKICIMGNTNQLHHNFIQDTIQEFQPPLPKISYILSFEEQNESLTDKVEEHFPSDSIQWHHNNPLDALTILLGVYGDQYEYSAVA